MGDIEVRPALWRVIVLAALCVVFTVGGLLLALNGELFDRILGGVAAVAFAVAGGYYLKKVLSAPSTYTLTPAGIRVGTGGYVPWSNLARVGVTKALGGAPALGIQLRNTQAFANTVSGDELASALSTARGLMGAARFKGSEKEASAKPKADLVAALNRVAKKSDGFHLAFPLMNLHKSAEAAAKEIEGYGANR